MIKRKIILDRRGIWDKKIITLILVILVVVSVLMFLFKVDINNYLKNLPGYSVPEEDEEINVTDDEGLLKGLCLVEIGKIGVPEGGRVKIGDKQHIYFDGEKTNLYWDADEKEGYIKILKKDSILDYLKKDVRVAEVKEGVVFVNPDFFDLNSEEYQKIRFIPKVNVSYFVRIHKSYYAGSNFLCKDGEEDIEIDYGFPEHPIILSTESLKLKRKKKNELKIDFSPYITLPEDSRFEFLYLKNRGEYMEIKGYVVGLFGVDWLAIDYTELGSIYPDGSVWLNRERLTKKRPGLFKTTLGARISEEVAQKYRGIYPPYYESNLRVNYEEVKKF